MLRGGLGNQLFQYAAGFSQARQRNVPLELDCSLLPSAETLSNKIGSWPEQLSAFNHYGKLINTSINSRQKSLLHRYTHEALRLIGKKFPNFLSVLGGFSFEGDPRSFDLSMVKNLSFMNSYFASPRFFE